MATENRTVVQAVAITASISLLIAGILFYFLYQLIIARRLKQNKLASSFRREASTAVPRVEFRQQGGTLKGIIVDEQGLDVLYLRKPEDGHLSGCFSKVWYNPMGEEVKKMNSRGDKVRYPNPIQEVPLLQEPSCGYAFEETKPVDITSSNGPKISALSTPEYAHFRHKLLPLPPMPGIRRSPPTPPPTPLHETTPQLSAPPPLLPSKATQLTPLPVLSKKGNLEFAAQQASKRAAPRPTPLNETAPRSSAPPPLLPFKATQPPPLSKKQNLESSAQQASKRAPRPPTPLNEITPRSSAPPPPPPPPATQPPPPPPLPKKGNLMPSAQQDPKTGPALTPVRARGFISPNKPPIPPRGSINRHDREDSLMDNSVQMKLKPLHWEKVTANADHSTVWNEISNGSFRFDDELMETLFGYNTTTRKSTEKCNKSSSQGSSSTVPSAHVFHLDPRKSQNIAIVLKSIAISRKEIHAALFEGEGLNADILEKLTKICPTQEEITKILQYSGNPTKLADAESFLYDILKAVPSAFIRFNAMLFRITYDPEILHLKEHLQTLELGCKELRRGGVFFKLLEAILKAGNRMNAGTARGNAQGFNLTALQRLADVKSTDGKTTLLYFVVEQIIRYEGKRCLINRNHRPENTSKMEQKEGEYNPDTKKSNEDNDGKYLMLGLPVVESLGSELVNVKKAAAIDYDSFISISSNLTARVDEIKQILTRRSDKVDGFLREMKGFLEDCGEELTVMREEELRVLELVKKTTTYYQAGASKDNGVNPFQLFIIVNNFLSMVDQVCVEIAKKLQKTKVITAGLSPPLSPTPRSPTRFQNFQLYFMAQMQETRSSDSEDDFR